MQLSFLEFLKTTPYSRVTVYTICTYVHSLRFSNLHYCWHYPRFTFQ